MSLFRTLAIRRLKKNDPHMDQKLTLQVVQTLHIIYHGVGGVPGTLMPGYFYCEVRNPTFYGLQPSSLLGAGLKPKLTESE